MTNDLLTAVEVADWLQVPVSTLYQWRYHHEGPPAARVGKHLRYRAPDVEAWIQSRVEPSRAARPKTT